MEPINRSTNLVKVRIFVEHILKRIERYLSNKVLQKSLTSTALKALPKDQQKDTIAYLALKQIQAIYREENKLEGMSAQERLKNRQLTVKPLVDAYFIWVKKNVLVVAAKSKTANGLTYSINQETYLKTFLEDG